MEEDGYIKFCEPKQTLDTCRWFARSEDPDHDGQFWFLTFNAIRRSRVAKAFEAAYEITCDSELQVHKELALYYDYHGDAYPYEQRRQELINNTVKSGTSQPMEFI